MKILIYEKKINKKYDKKFVNLKHLISNSDIISLNINYNEKLKYFFDYKYFQLMKKTSLFVNTSRGELISEGSLIKALKKIIAAQFLMF